MTKADPTARLPRSCLRVLESVLALAETGQPITMRRIALQCGWTGVMSYVRQHLRRLRACGLVAFEDDKARTIVPTCYYRAYRPEKAKS